LALTSSRDDSMAPRILVSGRPAAPLVRDGKWCHAVSPNVLLHVLYSRLLAMAKETCQEYASDSERSLLPRRNSDASLEDTDHHHPTPWWRNTHRMAQVLSLLALVVSTTTSSTSSMTLGAAALSSLTDALAPILPFAGGVDLRTSGRDESNWWQRSRHVWTDTQDAYKSKQQQQQQQLNATQTAKSTPKATHDNDKPTVYQALFSAPESFYPHTADLDLAQISALFVYARQVNQVSFSTILGTMSDPATRHMLQAVHAHVDPVPRTSASAAATGQIDATALIAALRLWADWRLQVPPGYPAYAVGMSLGHTDVVQNVGKLERVIFEYRQEFGVAPTVLDLLTWETHPKLPYLQEPSAAMGLLWVLRQVSYQTALFSNLLQVPSQFPTTRAACQAAYTKVYDPYHGWAVQKIFGYSLAAAPEASVLFGQMVGQQQTQSSSPVQRNPWQAAVHHVGGEWDKLVRTVGRVFHKDEEEEEVDEEQQDDANPDDIIAQDDATTTNDTQHIAQKHIRLYLQRVQPLQDELTGLLQALNMNDPTKV